LVRKIFLTEYKYLYINIFMIGDREEI
jgi:hypothetical protein